MSEYCRWAVLLKWDISTPLRTVLRQQRLQAEVVTCGSLSAYIERIVS